MLKTEVLILGAGGAGLFCARTAAMRGRQVIVVDHQAKVGGKIAISGGGRCNFTNLGASPAQYVSNNPHFCKSALARFKPEDFITLIDQYQIAYHEKKLGQLFCDGPAHQIVDLLRSECELYGVKWMLKTQIGTVTLLRLEDLPYRFQVELEHPEQGLITLWTESLVIALGGLSLPKIGATGLGHKMARRFGHDVTETYPALDGFSFEGIPEKIFCELSGISADVKMSCNGISFRENLLFTHSGLSGPVSLQVSLHWTPESVVTVDFLPDRALLEECLKIRQTEPTTKMKKILESTLSLRLSELLIRQYLERDVSISQLSDREIREFVGRVKSWTFKPLQTIGYSKAEVTKGGVDTSRISSKTMESQIIKKLYFVGEVLDVTGWLGGYNYQWAWASGFAAGQDC
jgi:predicted Rossmann fold flavoprotein